MGIVIGKFRVSLRFLTSKLFTVIGGFVGFFILDAGCFLEKENDFGNFGEVR